MTNGNDSRNLRLPLIEWRMICTGHGLRWNGCNNRRGWCRSGTHCYPKFLPDWIFWSVDWRVFFAVSDLQCLFCSVFLYVPFYLTEQNIFNFIQGKTQCNCCKPLKRCNTVYSRRVNTVCLTQDRAHMDFVIYWKLEMPIKRRWPSLTAMLARRLGKNTTNTWLGKQKIIIGEGVQKNHPSKKRSHT